MEKQSDNSGNSSRGRYEKGFRKNQHFRRDSRYGYQKDSFNKKSFKRNWSNTQNDGKRKRLDVGRRLKENEVGITEFIGNQGFFGVIKERYTDFHVNEITLDGEIVKLTNQDIPEDPTESQNVEDLRQTISDTIWDQLQMLKDPESSPVEIDVTDIDKDQRRTIHTIAKKITNVISQTIDRDNKKIMMILPDKQDSRIIDRYIRRDNRIDWKKNGEYCYFVLHKVNMDTMDALNQLARNLRMKANNFNYAGTKDRRAWTSQWVSLRKTEPLDILRAAKNVRGAFVGNFKFMKEQLRLGRLSGNHFRIAIRNVNGTDEEIENTMVSLRDNGFINYYGLQRFGSVAEIPTHEIGKNLLQSKWDEAIELILKPREGEQDLDLAEARRIYATTKNADAAYRHIRRCDKIEATLLRGICMAGSSNPQGALDALPRNARLMYIHAYQSLVWNQMVSKRIKEFGKKPIIGDLVYESNSKQGDDESEELVINENVVQTEDNAVSDEKVDELECENTIVDKEEEISEVSASAADSPIKEVTDATECCLKINENIEKDSTVNEKDEVEDSLNLPAVKILKEEDLPNYTLADVLMPQVGWKVIYPPYAKPWYEEVLAKDGLTTDLRQKNKKYSLGGAYRKILQIPTNLSWKIMHYKEKHSDLISCDIDEMRKLETPKDDPEGQYKALIVEMSLKSSTYATMALREILKFDTSPQAQAAQSASCNAESENCDISKDHTQSEEGNGVQDNKSIDEEKISEIKEEETTNPNVLEESQQADDKMECV